MTIETKKLNQPGKKIRPYQSKCVKGGYHNWYEVSPGTGIYECAKKCNSLFDDRQLIIPN